MSDIISKIGGGIKKALIDFFNDYKIEIYIALGAALAFILLNIPFYQDFIDVIVMSLFFGGAVMGIYASYNIFQNETRRMIVISKERDYSRSSSSGSSTSVYYKYTFHLSRDNQEEFEDKEQEMTPEEMEDENYLKEQKKYKKIYRMKDMYKQNVIRFYIGEVITVFLHKDNTVTPRSLAYVFMTFTVGFSLFMLFLIGRI